MKKLVQMVGVFISFLLMAVSCQNESLINQPLSQGNQLTLTANKDIASRTHLDGDQTVWSEGDQIYVSSQDGNVTGVLTLDKDDAGKSTGTFTGYVFGNPDKLAYSVYPVPSNGIIDLSQISGGDKLDAPMVGPIDNKHVQFVNTCGILRVNLQNAIDENFTISAKAGTENVKLHTIAKVVVDDNGAANLVYSTSDSSDGTISLNNSKGGFMYIPYYINKDVKFYVDNIEVASAKSDNFIGKVVQKDVKTLVYSEKNKILIEPTEVIINTSNITNSDSGEKKLTVNVSSSQSTGNNNSNVEVHEFVSIPSITESLENSTGEVNNVVIELPKVESSSSKTSVVSFDEIPNNVTVTITEETDDTKTSVEELTIILPSGATEETLKENVVIDMPNTTVAIQSTDGEVLLIEEMEATTADETLIVHKHVRVGKLNVKKGKVEVHGHIGEISYHHKGEGGKKPQLIIKPGGSVDHGKDDFDWKDENKPGHENEIIIKNKELSKALHQILGSRKVTINSDGFAVMTKLEADDVRVLDFTEYEGNIYNLTGIEYFTNLILLDCNTKALTACDLSKNTKLETVCVNNNNLKSLDFSHNPLLKVINCSHNEELSELTLTKCENLYNIHVHNTALKEIDITKPEKVETFLFGYTELDIELEPFTILTSLGCEGRYVGNLEIPNEMKGRLTTLFCSDNQLSEFDLADFPNLVWFRCENNNLTSLDLTKAPNISDLRCSGNQMEDLDLTPLISAGELYCGNQQNETTLILKLTDSQKETWHRIWYEHNENVVLYEEPKVLLLPTGSEISTALAEMIKVNTSITKIKFVANSETTSETLLVTDANGMKGYLVVNGEWLEIHTSASKFIANQYSGGMFYKQDESESPDYPVSLFRYITEIDFGDNFDTSNVILMGNMFYKCTSLTTVDVSGFNTSNVFGMEYMFSECRALKTVDVSNFDTSKVNSFCRMFYQCDALESIDVSGFDTSEAVTMDGMFAWCPVLKSLDVSKFDTSNVTNMSHMFYNCKNITELNVENFDTSKVTDMGGMFGHTSMTTLKLSNFNTSKVTDMEEMFHGCKKLKSLNLSTFDTSNVTDMDFMFEQCNNLEILNISSFDTSEVTSMQTMFCMCYSLTSLDVSEFNTSKVTMMNGMFYGCSKLTSIDVSKFNTSNVTTMQSMFYNCYNLAALDLTSFSYENTPTVIYMFKNVGKDVENKPIPIKILENGYNYMTKTTTNCDINHNYAKFVNSEGIDW